ncbi:MAG: MmgE/PrpD family protein, partial [Deltaproteobacteria bacterium]|nr:MmgE/PrpD family protein [Deltaproteobacteria bacterium]
ESMNIAIKRCAVHINAHAPIEALEELRREIGFKPDEIRGITIGSIEKLLTHHANYEPGDLMMAQYSIPSCVALSAHYDPSVPANITEKRLKDKKILALMPKIRLEVDHEIEQRGWDRAARVTVELNGGKKYSKLVIHFKGTPHNPFSYDEVSAKARKLTRGILNERQLGRLINSVQNLEKVPDVAALGTQLRRAS